jgi:hypothetical protein
MKESQNVYKILWSKIHREVIGNTPVVVSPIVMRTVSDIEHNCLAAVFIACGKLLAHHEAPAAPGTEVWNGADPGTGAVMKWLVPTVGVFIIVTSSLAGQ